MSTDSKRQDSSSVNLTIRLIMQGKEVGSIIGKKGDNIKKIREESKARISISDGICPERIVTITGDRDSILSAFLFIARKFEELNNEPQNGQGQNAKAPVTLRLIVPASQCGSLIGKGGSKIKEIREISGATIQVASEMLPNSTERAVTLGGNAESISKCIYHICSVMLDSPPKGATIPYRPKSSMPPVIFAGGQAYTIQGHYAIPHPDLTKLHQLALQHAPLMPGHNVASLNPQAAAVQAAALAATTTTNMTIPNEVIGCIIGKGGSKINEIRQLSGATIRIGNPEEGFKYRTISITGTSESINLAQYLIHTSMELHKNLSANPNGSAGAANASVAARAGLLLKQDSGASGSKQIAQMLASQRGVKGPADIALANLNKTIGGANGALLAKNVKNVRKFAPY